MTRKEDDEENENEEGENDASSIKKGINLLECILKAFRSLSPPLPLKPEAANPSCFLDYLYGYYWR